MCSVLLVCVKYLQELVQPAVFAAAVSDCCGKKKAVSKFLKELSRKFLVMICMTQNRRPFVRICSQQHFLEVAFFLIISETFVKHSRSQACFRCLKHVGRHECFLRRFALEHLTPPKHWRSRAATFEKASSRPCRRFLAGPGPS